jgi:hypothetical protein
MIAKDDGDLPWLEDIIYVYYINTVKNTFPSTDFTTVFIALAHIIGFYTIYLGIFLPPKYIWAHTLYLGIILISYYIFDKNCFMTLLANMDTETSKTPIYVRMSTATKFLVLIFIYSILLNIFPNISPFRIIKNAILKMEPVAV